MSSAGLSADLVKPSLRDATQNEALRTGGRQTGENKIAELAGEDDVRS